MSDAFFHAGFKTFWIFAIDQLQAKSTGNQRGDGTKRDSTRRDFESESPATDKSWKKPRPSLKTLVHEQASPNGCEENIRLKAMLPVLTSQTFHTKSSVDSIGLGLFVTRIMRPKWTNWGLQGKNRKARNNHCYLRVSYIITKLAPSHQNHGPLLEEIKRF